LTFNAERVGSGGESVSNSPDLWFQGLEMVSNAATLRVYKLKGRGCWTSGIVVDWENEPLDSLKGEVGVVENGKTDEH
jgi:hypothetical protein